MSGVSGSSTNAVLAVCSALEDVAALQTIFANSRWRLYLAASRAEAIQLIADHSIRVVISVADQADGTWRGLLAHGASLRKPPKLIVAAYFADDRLWAEALNLGAHDVLAMPFRATEVFRNVSLAWRSWTDAFGESDGQDGGQRACMSEAS